MKDTHSSLADGAAIRAYWRACELIAAWGPSARAWRPGRAAGAGTGRERFGGGPCLHKRMGQSGPCAVGDAGR
jgi:hypothetical protein